MDNFRILAKTNGEKVLQYEVVTRTTVYDPETGNVNEVETVSWVDVPVVNE